MNVELQRAMQLAIDARRLLARLRLQLAHQALRDQERALGRAERERDELDAEL